MPFNNTSYSVNGCLIANGTYNCKFYANKYNNMNLDD